MAGVVVLSTHLDDAVLSCWSVISSPDQVTVLTVFTGGPAPGVLTPWDEWAGAEDSAARMEERREEDRAALAVAGRTPVHLGLLESQYLGVPPTVPWSALEPYLRDADLVYAPAALALGRPPHADHIAVRDAVLGGRPDAILYADQPYCRFQPDVGRPTLLGRIAEPVVLSPAARLGKVQAIRCYAGELPLLEDPKCFGPFVSPETLTYELFWRA